MVLAFSNFQGLIYSSYVVRGTRVNSEHFKDTCTKLFKTIGAKRPNFWTRK